VYNPSEVQQDIFYRMGERLEEVRQFEIESQRERIAEWIASYHRKSDELRNLRRNAPPEEDEIYRPEDF
jgi:molecular chaperone GrpE (heat shock protein)